MVDIFLEFLTSFEILNASVMSPIHLEDPAPTRYPWVKMFSLFPYRDDDEVLKLIAKDNRPRKTARALVLVNAEDPEQAIGRSSDFIHTICDLQGLAQRNSVSFWGVVAYCHIDDSWRVERKSWNVVRTEPSWSFFGHGVATTELQGHFRKWLEVIDGMDFPIDDFTNSVHLLSDSYRPDQFQEVMFLEAWVAFELLANQLAERAGSEQGAAKGILKKMKKDVEKYIEQNFRKKVDGKSYKYVKEQLSALERIPVGHLIERFASVHGIETKKYEIERLKKIRNGLMHYGKEPSEYPLDLDSLVKMRQLLEDSLLAMIKTKEVNRSERPMLGPTRDEELVPLDEGLDEYSMSFDAQIKNGNGRVLTQGKFDVNWTCEKIEVSGDAGDPWALLNVMNDDSAVCSLSGRGKDGVVIVSNARPTRLGHSKLELVAFRVVIDTNPGPQDEQLPHG